MARVMENLVAEARNETESSAEGSCDTVEPLDKVDTLASSSCAHAPLVVALFNASTSLFIWAFSRDDPTWKIFSTFIKLKKFYGD